MTDRDENRELSKREERRKRRKRTQIVAYVSVVFCMLACVAGIIFGARYAARLLSDRKQEAELARELEERQAKEAAEAEAMAKVQAEIEAEAEPIETYTEEDLVEEVIDSVMSGMTLEEKVAWLFFITPEALTGVERAVQAGDSTEQALLKYPVGGLIYFDKNIQSEEQFKEMISQTGGSKAKFPLFFAVDEEGGRVARLAGSSALSIENVGPMGEIGASGDTAAAYTAGNTIGAYLSEYGINVDFAPVADVLTDPNNSTIGDRSFGTDPALVGQMAAQAAAGLQDAGISACLKHFPGLGGTTVDTHDGLAKSERTLEELQAEEFLGFKPAIENGVDMVMVAHLALPEVTGDDTPSSLSRVIITDILRGQLGYDGIVITDALNMGAITKNYSSAEAAVMALQAGADMLLMPENFEQAYAGVLEAIENGTLSEERIDESVKRICRVKYRGVLED